MPEFAVDSPLFNRRTFQWKPGSTDDSGEQVFDPDAVADRVYQVLEHPCTVRSEPHLSARMKTRKSGGARVVCSEITMNGWLKLSSEPGWLLCNMQGIDGICDVAYPADAPVLLPVPLYQPQGMCCLEVVADAGVPVLESASRQAKTLATLGRGEYVFSHTQNFDGWLRVAPGEGGWVCCQGGATLLRARTDVQDVDLWALADLWASARRALGKLGADDVDSLKELERTVASEAKSVLDDLPDSELQGLVEDGFLEPEDTSQPRAWILQRLFAHMLQLTVAGDSRFQDFRLSPRLPPLPAPVGEEEAAAGDGALESAWDEGALGPEEEGDGTAVVGAACGQDLQPFKGPDGREYLLTPTGALLEGPGEAPVGQWNAASGLVEPVAGVMPGCPYDAIRYFGKTFLLTSDNKLLDWDTNEMFAVSSAEDVKAVVLQL